jgi:hypothetical protein
MPMQRKYLAFFFGLLLAGCASHPPLSPVSAAELAARLANERCHGQYGRKPFTGDDFEAVLEKGRWHWGGGDKSPIDGFITEVSFDRDGSGSRVVLYLKGEEPE